MQPFTPGEVRHRLLKCQNSSPGADRLTYAHWRRLDPDGKLLALIFNICLKHRRVPESWKASSTILLPKKGDLSNIKNWRPIALCSTISKLYSGLLASRLSKWLVANEVLSHCQKGFLPFDGVLEHNFLLLRRMEKARLGNRDLCTAFLDISEAFPSVPHAALVHSLSMAGAGEAFTDIIADFYSGVSTCFRTISGDTAPLPLRQGVKQGDPLSPLLFNLVLDPLLHALQPPDSEVHQCSAYADDVAVLRDSPAELQEALDLANSVCTRLGFRLNPAKCVSFHLSGRTPVGMRASTFSIAGTQIRALRDGEHFRFLGNPVGFNICSSTSSIAKFIDVGKKLLESELAPWQKLDAVKTFLFPSFQFSMRMGSLRKADWSRLDKSLRGLLKSTLNVPMRAANGYLYGSSSAGCCNIPLAAEESDIFLADAAFKLLTSRDPRIAGLASKHLEETVSGRLSRPILPADLSRFLSGCQDGEFRGTTSRGRNVWTCARSASYRLGLRWQFASGASPLPTVTAGAVSVSAFHRCRFASTVRTHLRSQRDVACHALPDQGKVLECVAKAKASHHFLRTGDYTAFADWRFIHRARLNLLPLNGCRPWTRGNTDARLSCRRCGHLQETLPHVLHHCLRYSRLYQQRHNNLVSRLKKAAAFRHTIMAENQEVGVAGLRPDLVIRQGGTVTVIDVTVPFPNRWEAVTAAAAEKCRKYEPLIAHLRRHYPVVKFMPFVIGSLGVWWPDNDKLLAKICSPAYANTLRLLCVADVISTSRIIYNSHVSATNSSDTIFAAAPVV